MANFAGILVLTILLAVGGLTDGNGASEEQVSVDKQASAEREFSIDSSEVLKPKNKRFRRPLPVAPTP